MAKQINAQIVADSVNIQGNRITTYVLTYPRMIHAEVMTHRMFSRNAASSRAIPFEKMLKMVEEDPFIPIAWQQDHKGMQGIEYFTKSESIERCKEIWLSASRQAILMAKVLSGNDVTKQLCNRLLEPFLWYTALVTTTEYDNFFELRCPKYYYEPENIYFKSKKDWISRWDSCFEDSIHYDWTNIDWLKLSKSGAEIHIQALAEAMWDARNESEPRLLKAGEWHIPFGDQMDNEMLYFLSNGGDHQTDEELNQEYILNKVRIAIARCARLSYMTFEGGINYDKDIELFKTLYNNKHMSPFEHVAKAMSDYEYSVFAKVSTAYNKNSWTPNPTTDVYEEGWCKNFKGFIQYRFFLENEKEK